MIEGDQIVGDRQQERAVGHHEDRALAADLLEGTAEFLFRLAVETGRGFVEKQDGWIADQGAGDGDALPLPAGKATSGLADIGRVTIRHVDDELVDPGGGGGLDDLVVVGVGLAVGDVLAHGALEQDAVLGHVAHPLGELGARELGDVGAIEKDAALVGRVQALDQLEQRALAAAVAPDQRVHAPRFEDQTDVVDNRRQILDVGVGDTLDGDLALRTAQGDGAFLALRDRIEHGAQALHRLLEAGVGAPRADQLVEGADETPAQHVGGDKRAHGELPLEDGDGADGGQRQGRDHGQRGAHVGEEIRPPAALDRIFDVVGMLLFPQRTHGAVEGQGLDGGTPGDDLGHQAVAALRAFALVLVGVGHARPRSPGDEQEERQDNQQDPAQGLGDDEDKRQEDDDERQVRHQNRGGPRERVADRVHVAEERLPIGSRHGLQGTQRQGHQLVEEGAADVDVDPERHGLHDAPARRPEDVIEDEHPDHADQQAVQRAYAALEYHPVVNLHREDRHRQRHEVHEKGQQHDLAEGGPQGLEKWPQPRA